MDNFNKLTQMAVSKQAYIQIQLVNIGSLPKIHKLRICVHHPPPTPLFGAPFYATVGVREILAYPRMSVVMISLKFVVSIKTNEKCTKMPSHGQYME